MATIVPSMNEQDLAILQLQRGSTYRRDNARGSMRLAAPLSDESEPGTTRVTHNLDTDKQLPTHLWSERDYAQYKKAGKAPSSAPASTRTVVNMTEVTVFQEETHARSPANMDNAQSEAVPVRVQFHFLDLTDIDTVSQSFHAHVSIQCAWRESLPPTAEIDKKLTKQELMDHGIGLWRPVLTLVGAASVEEKEESLRPQHNAEDRFATVFFRLNVLASFSRTMKLSTFPFDTQLLKVRAILYACPQRVNGRPPARRIQFQAGKSEVYPEGFIQSNAYTIDDEIILMQGRTRPLHEDCVEYTTISAIVSLHRHATFFYWNYSFPTFILGFTPLSTFFFDVHDLPNRMNITVLVLLTTVAFKSSVSENLPVTTYLTVLDCYMIILLTMQSLLGLLNIIVFVLATTYEGTDFCYKFNLWAGATLGVFWLLAYCPSLPLIVWYCRKHDSRRRRRDKTDFREEQELPLSVL